MEAKRPNEMSNVSKYYALSTCWFLMSLRPSVKKVTWGSAIRHGVTKQNKAVMALMCTIAVYIHKLTLAGLEFLVCWLCESQNSLQNFFYMDHWFQSPQLTTIKFLLICVSVSFKCKDFGFYNLTLTLKHTQCNNDFEAKF